MEKYIGNKKRIVDHIGNLVGDFNIDQGVFLDIFAGTNNVGKFFKQKGFEVISNDLNECAFVFGKAFIEGGGVPQYLHLIERYNILNKVNNSMIEEYLRLNKNGHVYFWSDFRPQERNLIKILAFLSFPKNLSQIIKSERSLKSYPLIFRNYCPGGSLSSYEDRFGSPGKRMFFTNEHGKQIDAILNLLRFWKNKRIVSDHEFYILLSSLVHAASLFSNTSGVYEAFYKNWFPNTQQQFRLPVPDLAALHSGPKGKSYCMDANNLVHKINKQIDVLYIDPPYNSRQYNSNYHLLNTIAKFHDIEDFSVFESGLMGVRGQHKETNHRSPFSSRKDFQIAMEDLIYSAKAKYVVVSYFDGDDNLWNQRGNYEGIKIISSILKNPKHFKKKSFKVAKIPRQNFQSRIGLKKEMVNELLFSSEKIQVA